MMVSRFRAALERIEILRDPASTLYGQAPIAGVAALSRKLPQAADRF